MPEFDVVGSFDGLLCLADAVNNVALYIYNPFTKDYIQLPRTTQYPNRHRHVVFGFGYSPLTEVYKVVKITYYNGHGEYYGYRDCRTYYSKFPRLSDVQIFTTGRPIWRSIGSASHYLDASPAETLVNGRLHWATWTSRRLRSGGQLVSFDLYDEQFREVPTPEFGSRRCIHPLVVGGCLAAVGLSIIWQLDIWVMKEYGVRESWVRQWSIGRHIPQTLEQKLDDEVGNYRPWTISRIADKARDVVIRVLNVSESGHILLEYKSRALVLYDPTNGKFIELEFEGMPRWFQTVVHQGRLDQVDTIFNR
ncbi:putative F-box associated interaction domain-containing protein [Rosa chinensis]|uniref:Putative F-box associated interaction domain-containing protein n=1 Tax=Rosa chinensis TaxID=74649 RepID=A0A2P6PB07_ROSCH|nr:F-box protein At3g07870 [Rosa chinensis]PRQ19104.1 putative F-box associated interaction domain-containing protein [Rosa chinensis]